MGYFNDVLMFLGLEHGCSVAVWVRKLLDFIKNIFICVLKMNEDLMAVE